MRRRTYRRRLTKAKPPTPTHPPLLVNRAVVEPLPSEDKLERIHELWPELDDARQQIVVNLAESLSAEERRKQKPWSDTIEHAKTQAAKKRRKSPI